MLRKKLIRTIFRYKAQVISMILMIILGIGVFLGFCGEYYSIEKDTFSFYDKTGFPDYELIDAAGYSSDNIDKIKNLDGIIDATRFVSLNTNVKKDNDILGLSVSENQNVSSFILMSGEEYDENDVEGLWLSDKYAEANNYKLGDIIELKYQGIEFKGIIKGLVKSSLYLICIPDSSQLMPDYKTYGFCYVSPNFLIDKLGTIYYPELHIKSNLSKAEISKMVDSALGKTNLILTKDDIVSYTEAQGEAKEGKTMATILPVIFLGIAFLIMVTTLQRITINEKTIIGTLKALGFRDKRIILHYTSLGLIIGIIGSILGILLGYFIVWFIFNPNGSMGTYFDLPSWKIYIPWWSILVVLLIILLLTLLSFIYTKKMLVGSASETLKPYVVKNMKRLRIEDSKRWRKLNFATKWNLRDVFRHKTRSLMSLFGVFGCTVLLVASFLMNDSMIGFVNKFYKESMQYGTMISLSEETTNDKAININEYFKGDYSANSMVEYETEAISMEIYHLDHHYVSFLDKKIHNITLNDEGVYIGTRMEEQYNLKPGDKMKIKIYGTNLEYEVRVEGIIRSLSKGIVMTNSYADKAGIDYKINRIYTNINKETVNNDNNYKENIISLKSKTDIINSFDTFMQVMYTMIGALIVISVILGIIVLYNLGTMSYLERYRELSTLKVLGFKDKKIGNLLITQNLWITIIGLILGYPAGVLSTLILLKALASEYEVKIIFGIMTLIIPLLLVLLVSLFVSFLVAKKNKKIDMVASLKVGE